MEKKATLGIVLTLLMIGMSTLESNVPQVKAGSLPLIFLDPPEYTALVGEDFTIAINVSDVVDLCGYDIWLNYDSSILEVTEIYVTGPGQVAPSDPALYTFINVSVPGSLKLAVIWNLWLDPPSFNGSGTLVWIAFKATNVGTTTLDFDTFWTHLYACTIEIIPMDPPVGGSVTVLAPALAPVAVITAPPEAYVDEAVTFSGSDSYDPDGGPIVGYQWDFGDGTTSTEQTPIHTYILTGTYEVTLVVTDDEGQVSDPATHVIRIKSPTEAIQELIETIESWNLSKGIEISLTFKLEEAIKLLNMGNENGAIHKLMDFINEVEALRSKGMLEDWQADYLVAETQTIISVI